MEILKAERVCYTYQSRYQKVEALRGVDCSFEQRMFYAITGESGSGKSTLLSLLAGLDLPTQGEIYVKGESIRQINRDDYRKNTASVVYQAFNLLPLLTAVENVSYPLEMRRVPRKAAIAKARECILSVGLSEKIFRQFPQMMSGGEQQRVAIARALAAGGDILLADEPTGNLDSENESNIVGILKYLAHEKNMTVIVITHNPLVAEQADIEFRMKDGKLSIRKK